MEYGQTIISASDLMLRNAMNRSHKSVESLAELASDFTSRDIRNKSVITSYEWTILENERINNGFYSLVGTPDIFPFLPIKSPAPSKHHGKETIFSAKFIAKIIKPCQSLWKYINTKVIPKLLEVIIGKIIEILFTRI